jgi:uncharacterized protein (UPF0333 family)
MSKKKSQASFEFLLIFGIALIIILVLGGIFFSYSLGAQQSLNQQQIDRIGKDLMNTVQQIYFLGSGNKVTLNTRFPEEIENISIHHMYTDYEGESIEFDYLNISYSIGKDIVSTIYQTNELYTRFNCTNCTHLAPPINISFYNDTQFEAGPKEIRLISRGDYVDIEIVQE